MLHEQSFQHGYLDASPMQGNHLVGLHLVQRVADVQSAVVQLLGYLLHQDIKSLWTSGIDASREEETDDALA